MSNSNSDLEKFHDLFSTDFIELYSEIKDYLHINAFDLLNKESLTTRNDFVELIFKNVRFEPMEEEDLEEEDQFVEL